MDDECRVVEGGTFFTRHLGCLSRDSRRPLFLVCLVAGRSRGNGWSWVGGEREYASGTEPQIAWARSFLCW